MAGRGKLRHGINFRFVSELRLQQAAFRFIDYTNLSVRLGTHGYTVDRCELPSELPALSCLRVSFRRRVALPGSGITGGICAGCHKKHEPYMLLLSIGIFLYNYSRA